MRNDQPKSISKILKKITKSLPPQPSKPDTINFTEIINTSYGMKLRLCDDGHYSVNTDEIRILPGIMDYVHILTMEIIESCKNNTSDILIKRSIDKSFLPEMAKLHINSISIYIRDNIAKIIENSANDFYKQMVLVFNTIKRPKWRNFLLPQSNGVNPGSALLFPFNLPPSYEKCFILLEYVHEGRFLRLTFDSYDGTFLFLKRISHRIVSNADRQTCLPNIDRIAQQLFQGILHNCQNEQDEYIENPVRQSELFDLLISIGLERLSVIKFVWDNSKLSSLIISKKKVFSELLTKILLLLEDRIFTGILQAGRTIEMLNETHIVYFETSRNGSCLNLSIDKKREVKDPAEFLKRMPALEKTTLSRPDSFTNTRILLIHHITTEIVGFLKSLDMLKAEHITTLFIKYKGIASEEIMETIFTLAEERFKFYSLQKIETSDSVEGKFVLSRRYSPVEYLMDPAMELEKKNFNFTKSMKFIAANLFFREAFKAKESGQKILLIEDGGYIAPEINKLCLENSTLQNALDNFAIRSKPEGMEDFPSQEELDLELGTWLKGIFYGSIEHTKNGFVSVRNIQDQFGSLAFPCCTIAMSVLKNTEEARECANAILNAIESIFNGTGKILSNRNVMVLGSRGFIGRNLMKQLSHRLIKGCLCGVDISLNGNNCEYLETKSIEDLPDEIFLNTDLIIGMTGVSVMKRDIISKLILYGKKQEIFFASGSTKTVEFEDLSNYLEEIKTSEKPLIADINVSIGFSPIKDKQTGIPQGMRVRVNFLDRNDTILFDHKDIYLLGDLMPINFLYYGVPTEVMDLIFAQLLKVTVGLVKDRKTYNLLPDRLLAIDFEIDENANLIHKRGKNE